MNKRQRKKLQKRQKVKVELQDAITAVQECSDRLCKAQYRNILDYHNQIKNIGITSLETLTLLNKLIIEYSKEHRARQDKLNVYEAISKADRDTLVAQFDHLNERANEHYKIHFRRLQDVIERIERRERDLMFWTFGCVVVTVVGLIHLFLS